LKVRSNILNKISFGMLGTPPSKLEAIKDEHKGLKTGGKPLLTNEVRNAVSRDSLSNALPGRALLAPHTLWSAPHFMAGINMNIVHATAQKVCSEERARGKVQTVSAPSMACYQPWHLY